jgi:hypothetical protein
MAYMQLHENPEGEGGKGVLNRGVVLRWRAHQWSERHHGEGPKEWSRRPKKWSRTSSLAARGGVGGVEEQPEEATVDGVLAEEDDDRELSLPGFTSWHRRQVLSAGGAR